MKVLIPVEELGALVARLKYLESLYARDRTPVNPAKVPEVLAAEKEAIETIEKARAV